MSGYNPRFNHNYPQIKDDSEVYSEADELYLAMDGINEFQTPVEKSGLSAQLNNILSKSFESRNPLPSPHRRPINNQWTKPAIPQRSPLEGTLGIPKPRDRRHSAAPSGFAEREKAHTPVVPTPFSSRMPAFSGHEIADQSDYLTFDPSLNVEKSINAEPPMKNLPGLRSPFGYDMAPPALPYHTPPSPFATERKKKPVQCYDDHALPSRPPPQPPRPQERIPSSKSDGHSPVTSRPPSLKDLAPFHSHIPDRKHNRSTDSASSTSSDDLPMVPKPMVTTGPAMSFSKAKKPTMFPSMNRTHVSAPQMPPLEPVAPPSMPDSNTDLSRPTEEQQWFMDTSREGAQRAIEGRKQNGIFVVRPKYESNFQPYAITLWANGAFKNLVIRKKADGEFALGSEKAGELSFKTVVAMIDYYQKHELNIAASSAITLISGP